MSAFVNMSPLAMTAANIIAALCWTGLGLIHLTPAVALVQPALISRLYRVPPGSATFLLLHHRAALFLVIVLVCAWAVWRPDVRPLASAAVATSMLSFLWLFAAAGQPAALRQIALVDLAGLPLLAVAAWLAFRPLGA